MVRIAAEECVRSVELFGRIENLLDEKYQTAAGYNQAPRGVFAGVRVRL